MQKNKYKAFIFYFYFLWDTGSGVLFLVMSQYVMCTAPVGQSGYVRSRLHVVQRSEAVWLQVSHNVTSCLMRLSNVELFNDIKSIINY